MTAVFVQPALGALGPEQEPPTATALGALALIHTLVRHVVSDAAVAWMAALPPTIRRQVISRFERLIVAGEPE